MAKTLCTVVGVVFLLVGLLGFASPTLLGTHLSLSHNLVHLISGAIALYLGISGSIQAARVFCLVFGAVYLLLGIAGFILGNPGQPTIVGMEGMTDSYLLVVIPGNLELGMMDHIIHVLLGVVFVFGGITTKPVASAN
jgi:Domain of unknown function (DUF4383)